MYCHTTFCLKRFSFLFFSECDDGRVGITTVGRRRRGWRLITRRHGRSRLRHVLYSHRGGWRSGRSLRFRVRCSRVLVSVGRGSIVDAALRHPSKHAGYHSCLRAVPVHRPEPVPQHRHFVVLPTFGKSHTENFNTKPWSTRRDRCWVQPRWWTQVVVRGHVLWKTSTPRFLGHQIDCGSLTNIT